MSGRSGIGRRTSSIRVLVVEDDPGDADLVKEALRDSPERLDVDWVPRLGEAKQRFLSDCPPDVVLLDLRLPDAQGLEALDDILGVAAGAPIVVLTGSDDARVAVEAVHRGAQDYLSKDILLQPDQLPRAVWHALERQRLLSEAQRQSRLAQTAAFELRRLIESHVDGMIVVDPGGIVLFANRAAEDLLDRGGEDLLGLPLPLPDDWERTVEVQVGSDRKPCVAELRSAEIEWNGAPARIISLRDITERKAAEQMRSRLLHSERLRSIGQLAAGIAHEINNPAAFITVNQETLRGQLERIADAFQEVRAVVASWGSAPRKELDALLHRLQIDVELEEVRTTLDENRSGLERVVTIVRSLRGFARVEQGHVEHVGVDELVEDACTMVQNEIRHRAQLVKELGGPPPIALDRGRVTQVLVNLLVNAAHAVDESRVQHNRITVRTRRLSGAVQIEVEDTGRGIPVDQQKHIFEPFFTTKGREEGMGLGLALSAEIIRQHGGEIRFESEVGAGTRFEIILPEHTGLEPNYRKTLQPTMAPERSGLRVLVIDDEAALLRGLRRMLGRHHEVTTALGGAEGMRLLQEDRRFDVVLCDLMMPEMDGPAVHAWVSEHVPEMLPRLVFMSGGAFTDRTRAFSGQWGVRVVDKPLSKHVLESILRQAG